MSSAFVRESGGAAQIFQSRDSAESAATIQRSMDGGVFDYEIRPRDRGGYLVARVTRTGEFDSWVEE